uniref:Uncharacterized protein n=1 Tax=Anguilla anguilla TaxID=7936 RepID=A0A0E9TJA0_ANGAN
MMLSCNGSQDASLMRQCI